MVVYPVGHNCEKHETIKMHRSFIKKLGFSFVYQLGALLWGFICLLGMVHSTIFKINCTESLTSDNAISVPPCRLNSNRQRINYNCPTHAFQRSGAWSLSQHNKMIFGREGVYNLRFVESSNRSIAHLL